MTPPGPPRQTLDRPAIAPAAAEGHVAAPVVTVVLVAHDEGLLLHRTLRSLRRAVAATAADGHAVETLLCLDRPTRPTLEYLARTDELTDRVLEFDLGDPGLVRNEAVRRATGRYVAFLDGDDLFSVGYLRGLAARVAAGAASRSGDGLGRTVSGGPLPIYHAAATLLFEGQRMLFEHIGSESPRFDAANFLFHCEWTCQFAAPREVMAAHPFLPTSGTPFGFEDWHVLGQFLAAGHPIRLVEGTTNFVRRKRAGGRHVFHVSTGTMLRPCPLFEPGRPATVADAAAPPVAGMAEVHPPFVPRPRTAERPAARRGTLATTATGRVLPFVESVVRGAARFVAPTSSVPAYVREDLAAIEDIEPLLTPDEGFLRRLWPYRPPRTVKAARWAEVAGQLPPGVSHIFLVPWLKHGGSDLETIHYIRAVADALGPDRVAVLATESADNPWAAKLPPGVTFVACHPWRDLLPAERVDVLARVLVQARPAVIHNMNSRAGYGVFLRHGAQLAAISKLFVSVFCEDVSRTGQTVGFTFDEVPAVERHLTGVFADNARILARLQNEFGFDPEMLHHHPQPVPAWAEEGARQGAGGRGPGTGAEQSEGRMPGSFPASSSSPRPSAPVPASPGRPLRVLWAGRLDRQKRPDTLRRIAERAAGRPLTFDAFGRSVMRSDTVAVNWRGLANLAYRGPFDGFASLDPARFDAFLLTSQWEGMPNVLLEAIEAGLPVVASAVGGVPEVIAHERTGLLVADPEDVDGFVAALDRLARDPALRHDLAVNARARLAERHTWAAFLDRLALAPGYLPAPSQADDVDLAATGSPATAGS